MLTAKEYQTWGDDGGHDRCSVQDYVVPSYVNISCMAAKGNVCSNVAGEI